MSHDLIADQNSLPPFCGFPQLAPLPRTSRPCPDDRECFALWQKYQMLDNVKKHSLLVAHIATVLARRSVEKGMDVNPEEVRASGLLHDLAKTWCLMYGGSHAMLGATWALQETGNYDIAQGVLLHVHWPWPLPQGKKICILPIFILYADKRVKHDTCVTIDERFQDLLLRYGHDEKSRAGIMASLEQTRLIQSSLSEQLEWNLDEDTFDCGRMVQ